MTRTVARDFMDAEERRGIAGETWNDVLKLLRSTFRHLLPQGSINPFDGLVGKETETIYRKPFNPEELKKILDAAKDDEFIRPIVVTGVCTAMRRGDCCLLKWRDVDLDKGFVTVKTNKTGVTVDIPIFPLLFDELSAREGKGEALVFPDQAEIIWTIRMGSPGGSRKFWRWRSAARRRRMRCPGFRRRSHAERRRLHCQPAGAPGKSGCRLSSTYT